MNAVEAGAEAFAQLYDDTAAHVYGIALQVVADPGQAAQVTEEVYLELWQGGSRATAASCSTLVALVARAHRLAVDRVRAAAPHHEGALDVLHPLSALLTSLPPEQGRALELSYFQGRRSAEVARTLGITPSAAHEQLRSGLIGLAGALGGRRIPDQQTGT